MAENDINLGDLPLFENKKMSGAFRSWGDYAVIGVALAILALLIFGAVKILTGGNSAAEKEAERLLAQCMTVVQPVDWPRISAYEEARIEACAVRKTSDEDVRKAISAYNLDGN
jgi:hypothetical protein